MGKLNIDNDKLEIARERFKNIERKKRYVLREIDEINQHLQSLLQFLDEDETETFGQEEKDELDGFFNDFKNEVAQKHANLPDHVTLPERAQDRENPNADNTGTE